MKLSRFPSIPASVSKSIANHEDVGARTNEIANAKLYLAKKLDMKRCCSAGDFGEDDTVIDLTVLMLVW